MRFFSSILCTTVAFGVLAACSGNMATPSASLPSDVAQNRFTSDLSPHGLSPQRINVLGRVAIRTSDNFYVSAVAGNQIPIEPNCEPGSVALHDNATQIGAWETFRLVPVPSIGPGPLRYAFQTSNGRNYITAVDGGGLGDPDAAFPSSQLLTNSAKLGAQEQFRIVPVGEEVSSKVAIQTPDGKHYVSAVNGGGCGGPNIVPFHTNATVIGPWEQFTLVHIGPARVGN
jgi:hypothetical protein